MGFELITDEEYYGESVVGESLLHWLAEMEGSPGIVVDEELAKATPCYGYETPEGKKLLFSRGIIGMLDQAQIEKYCPTVEIKPGLPPRVAVFREAAEVCKKEVEALPKGERLIVWLRCMGREIKKHGVELP